MGVGYNHKNHRNINNLALGCLISTAFYGNRDIKIDNSVIRTILKNIFFALC